MKFRRDAPKVLIGVVVVVVVGMAVLSNRLFSGLTTSVEEEQFKLMAAILEFNLKGAESRALARAEMMATLPTIREIFAAQDRERLLAECAEMFRIQKEKYGVDQAQFHIPPATSFLRLQAPDQFGDDLSKFRPMVLAVNKDHLTRKGAAIARSGPAMFGVVPVNDMAGNHIGSFEVGIDFGPMLDGLKAAYGLELTLFIEEEPLREFGKGVSGEILSENNRVGKYIKFHSTHWELMKGLATPEDLLALTEPVQFTRDALGVTYGVLLVPLMNSGGQPLGVIAVARDFSGSRAAAGRSLVWQASLALFAIVILAGAVLIVLRGFLLQPLAILGEHFGALVAGNREKTMDEPETLCEELQVLAQHHESLRNPPGEDEPLQPKVIEGGRS